MTDSVAPKTILIFSLDPDGLGRECQKALATHFAGDFSVEITDSTLQADLTCREKGIGLLVIDCATESINSLEVLISVSTRLPQPPNVLLLTGDDNNQVALRAISYGVFDTINSDKDGNFLGLLPLLAERLLNTGKRLSVSDSGHALHQSRTYRKMLATTSDGLFALDTQGHFWEVNPGFLQLTGFSRRELLGEPANKVFTDKSVAELRHQFTHLVEDQYCQLEVETHQLDQNPLKLQLVGMIIPNGDDAFLLSSVKDVTEFHRLSEALLESEERYRNIFETSPLGLALLDEELNILAYNESFAQSPGYNSTELLNQPITRLIPAQLEQSAVAFLRSVEPGEAASKESLNLTLNGETMDIAIHCRAQWSKGKKQLLAVTQDITERNRVMRELRESEARFREIFDSPAIALAVINTAGQLVEVNKAACLLGGYSRSQLLKLGRDDYLLEDSLRKAQRYVEQGMLGKSSRERLEVRHKNGAILPIEVFVSPFQYRGADHYLCVARDISETVEAEQSLYESQQRLIAQFEQSPLAIIEMDLDGTLGDWNPAAEKMFGHSRNQALGKNAIELLVREERHQQANNLLENLSRGKPVTGAELEMQNRQRRLLTVEWFVNPRLSDDGKIMGFIGNARDITEQKQLEKQLMRSQKMEAIGQLTGGIAHDFNNILTGVLGYAELALQRLKKGEDFDFSRYLANIIQAGERARDLVRHMLTYSRTEGTDLQPIDPVIVVKEVVNLLKSTMPSTLVITLDWEEKPSLVKADAVQLHQVLMNLCINAQQSLSSEHGQIDVSTSRTTVKRALCSSCHQFHGGEFLTIRVADNGVGMDGETKEKMFDPFFTTKNVGEGSGMGLSVVHGIVHQHGGHITVRTRPNKGSTFDIRLPIVKDEPEQKTTDSHGQTPPRGSQQKLLVVDDEPAICGYLKELLEGHGYLVSPFTSATKALEEFAKAGSDYDLVLTDYTMPEMTGAELAQKILAASGNMPVIIFTGHSDSFDEKKAKRMNVRKLFMKPVPANSLLQEIYNQLHQEG